MLSKINIWVDLMQQQKSVVFNQDSEVRHRLRKLGLTTEIVRLIARRVAAAKAEALEIDPTNAPGMLAYIHGVRATRMELLKVSGWRMSRAGNVESTVNDKLGIQICFQNVDAACTEPNPQAISGKGAGSRKLIQNGLGGQGELFGREAPESVDAIGSTPTVWVVCVSTDDKKLRAEVSCPEVFQGSQFAGFSERIWVVDEDIAPTVEPVDRPEDDSDSVEHEVRIARK
ncbi:hypothetical protein VITFI_CDS1577 [Vitreoscilla filiformis]|uniref:Uncharacterized protein n=1 Tax=Vitreoscilla filiformis TaxID=63 RepID=A0A221KEF4_VITFI|nr:hypothetical protein [Vitreoscilla filiformis]ASM77355.1 hypothetical protein VITFI_CDS1577 [Vitreoscilla filiformis]